ncbi:hypothetical protein GCU67_03505 [Modestobacter muralis]|uniref:Uncharacterized protein n=1 Tax=Modestobacter muralis TaxID=1608614 RepID=A0A6P0EQ83_9ACTN|nr:hypothetical protein [Modestobacter muralis]NEK93247.1 hypothetical protein [Modestobacter muralis]NEN50014.1 hypothetical protein [Modestobacter muralis]
MGKHSADDGAGVDPFVAAALAQRPAPAEPVAPRHAPGLVPVGADGTGGLGWPGDPADGSGLGWPAGDADSAGAAEQRPARSRGGWRRLFGGARQDDAA